MKIINKQVVRYYSVRAMTRQRSIKGVGKYHKIKIMKDALFDIPSKPFYPALDVYGAYKKLFYEIYNAHKPSKVNDFK